jgi:hypothetical protein
VHQSLSATTSGVVHRLHLPTPPASRRARDTHMLYEQNTGPLLGGHGKSYNDEIAFWQYLVMAVSRMTGYQVPSV